MLEFEFLGICIYATVKNVPQQILDDNNRKVSRIVKESEVIVRFWDFWLHSYDLYEIALVKSVTSFFQQSYWRRANKQICKIDLKKSITHTDFLGNKQHLSFEARQKAGLHYLHILYQQENSDVNEAYLDITDVLLLDIALGKALSMLSPQALPIDAYSIA